MTIEAFEENLKALWIDYGHGSDAEHWFEVKTSAIYKRKQVAVYPIVTDHSPLRLLTTSLNGSGSSYDMAFNSCLNNIRFVFEQLRNPQ